MRILLSLVFFLTIQGCATTFQLDPIELKGQQTVFQEGVGAILSKKRSIVEVRPSSTTYSSEKRPSFVITVFNGTDSPFNFSTENIKVYVDDIRHRIFTYDELIEEVKRQQDWAVVGAALNDVANSMNAANAGYSYHSGTVNAYAYGNSGNSAHGYGSYSGYTYDAAAAQQAQTAANAKTQAYINAIRQRTEQSLNALSSTMLKKTTIMPSGSHSGYITSDKIPNSNQHRNVKIVVSVPGEKHEFLFKHSKTSSIN